MKKLLVATLIATLFAFAAPVVFAQQTSSSPSQPIKGTEGPDTGAINYAAVHLVKGF